MSLCSLARSGPGVAHVAPHRRVRPLAGAVPVEPQVQLDERRDVVDHVVGEPQLLHALAGHASADDLVVVERHPPIGLEPPGARLADVMEQGGQAQHRIGSARRLVGLLEDHRLLEDREGVLVHVLVVVVLVLLQPEQRELRQDVLREAGVDEQGEAASRIRGHDDLHELLADPLRRDDRQPLGLGRHGRDDVLRDLEAELGGEAGRPHHPQRVVHERVMRRPGRADDARGQVGLAVEEVHEGQVGQPDGHRVDGEVAADQVAFEGVAEVDLRLAGLRVVLLGPVGGDLHLATGHPGADRAEPDAHVPGRLREAVEEREHRLGPRIGREVEVGLRRGGQAAEERIAHGTPDQGELVPGRREELPDTRQQPGERGQFDHGTPLGVGHARGGFGGHISRA